MALLIKNKDNKLSEGKFITFEGGEGTGKSTQVKLLAETLLRNGIKVITTREPGGSEGGELIREILVNGEVERWDCITEALLFYAARRDHVVKKILPALNEGIWVISDRFADSTIAYQASENRKGLSKENLLNLHNFTLDDFKPNLTFILDLPPQIGLARALARNADQSRFEKMTLEFHEKLRASFLQIAKDEPKRCVVISADDNENKIRQQILMHLKQKFKVVFNE